MLIVSPDQFPLPLGYRFYPTKEEILQFYLPPAINGEPLPSNALIEREIYGENREPWNIFDKDKKCSYWVFTMLKKKSKSRIDRTAGSGTWLGRSIKEVKDKHGNILGFDKYFSFTCKKDRSNRGSNGRWIMHEFSLSDEGLSDYVICKIENKDAVGSDHQDDSTAEVGSDHHESYFSTADVESADKKRKALEVNDEQMCKKTCVDDQIISNINQDNADERNPGSSSLANANREIWKGFEDEENQDPNKQLMIDSNSVEACKWNNMDMASFFNELNDERPALGAWSTEVDYSSCPSL
ncbi:NAC domain-containing protein 83-like [Durio zibethinus]|uniref:NAC domain-containing protein 83-like n=1 Tax=Durio zibethinus TaxID=66656 RepID=A0A6P5ZME1_DURZI|nr:NAC domain-containing protein 83-like [Durio zibethinus]